MSLRIICEKGVSFIKNKNSQFIQIERFSSAQTSRYLSECWDNNLCFMVQLFLSIENTNFIFWSEVRNTFKDRTNLWHKLFYMPNDYYLNLLNGWIDSQQGTYHECSWLSCPILGLSNQIFMLGCFFIRKSNEWNGTLLNLWRTIPFQFFNDPLFNVFWYFKLFVVPWSFNTTEIRSNPLNSLLNLWDNTSFFNLVYFI